VAVGIESSDLSVVKRIDESANFIKLTTVAWFGY
jgi:hypothetical protein